MGVSVTGLAKKKLALSRIIALHINYASFLCAPIANTEQPCLPSSAGFLLDLVIFDQIAPLDLWPKFTIP
jgi:hypothetical protein